MALCWLAVGAVISVGCGEQPGRALLAEGRSEAVVALIDCGNPLLRGSAASQLTLRPFLYCFDCRFFINKTGGDSVMSGCEDSLYESHFLNCKVLCQLYLLLLLT